MADQVIPRVLAHEGRLVLHAGAVKFDEQAITIIGGSGRGKSTLVASLDAIGWRLLGDDAIIVALNGEVFTSTAVYRSLRLFSDSVASLFPVSPVLSAVAHYTDKHLVSVPLEAEHETGPAALAAMFFLASEPPENGISLRQMSPAEACIGVISHSFSLDPTGRARARQKLAAASALAAAVPAFEIAYPHDYCMLPDVHAALRDQLAKLTN
jgi:ABC-type dipeptide/oligopeptide/nickel transport system ATPase subunit